MKVLFISDTLGQGGAQRQIVTVARLLKGRGYNVTVMCYGAQDFFYEILKKADIPVVWNIIRNPLLRIIKVRRFVRKGKYDAVISFLQTENILNTISSIGGHKWKVICGERSAKENIIKTRRGKIHGWLMRYADYIVCNSENARQMWMRHYPLYSPKLKVIYNNVMIGEVTTKYTPFKNGRLNILIAASYQYLKNPLNLAEALNLMDADLQSILQVNWYGRQEVVPGDTRAYDETIQLIEKYELQEVFILHEEKSNIIDIMNEADAVALFSWVEGLPNCICEGMMLGKPIIMTRISDYSALVDSKNGYLCEWNDPSSIKDAIRSLACMTKEELRKSGIESKRKAESLFSADVVTSKWIKLIES